MTLTIDLPKQTKALLDSKATSLGIDAETAAARALQQFLEWDAMDRDLMIEAICRGLESGKAGRVRPAADVLADMRAKLADAGL